MARNLLKKIFQGNNDTSKSHAEVSKNKPKATTRKSTSSHKGKTWIGVDLDGTLAQYSGWQGFEHIGKPIPLMLERVKQWQSQGYTIKIMTARASVAEGIPYVEAWLKKHGLENIEVTNQKDFDMLELWDDRAIQVIENTGKAVLKGTYNGIPKAPLLQQESLGKTVEPAQE